MLIFIIFLFVPDSTVNLDKIYNTIEIYNKEIYLATYTDNSLYVMESPDELRTVTFTDDVNYRISSLAITPFVLYLNSGRTIEKYYLASGTKEEVFTSKDISSFIVMDNEELIISDYFQRELIFLDFLYNRRLTISDISIRDMFYSEDILYTLTNNAIHLFDEHGNIHNTIKIPDASTNIIVQDSTILLYHKGKNSIQVRDRTWQIIELNFGIRDIAMLDQILVILEDNGSSLYFYDLSHIKK